MSRPKLEIPEAQVKELIGRGYNMNQCAMFFDVSPHTIKTHFAKLFETFGQGRLAKTKVLDLMWQHAIKSGNSFALKYLASEFLGYTEASSIDLKGYLGQIKDLSNEELAKLTEEKVAQLRAVKEVGDE